MTTESTVTLADCSVFRQTLQARSPRFVHGTALVLTVLLLVALVWATLTEADVIVRGQGIVRPVDSALAVKTPVAGRVAKVFFRETQEVKKDDVLLVFETDKQDNDVRKQELVIRTATEELAKGAALLETLARQHEADKAAVETRLAQALEEIATDKQRRELSVRQAEDELRNARSEEERERRLLARGATAASRWEETQARVHKTETELAKARLPVDEGKAAVVRKELEQLRANYQAKRQEQELRQEGKRGEILVARKALDNLHWERDQATIRSPLDGVVVSGDWKAGDFLEAGKVVAEVAVQRGFLFEVNVPSEERGHLELDLPARVKLDAFDFQQYGTLEGMVTFISEGSKAVENRGVFYTLKVKLDRDEVARGERRGRIKLGMAGTAEVVTSRESLLMLLLKKIRRTISLG